MDWLVVATECNGLFAPNLATLGRSGHLGPDFRQVDRLEKNGYRITITAKPGPEPARPELPAQCSGAVSGYVTTAVPLSPGMAGRRFFSTDDTGRVMEASDATFKDAKQVE